MASSSDEGEITENNVGNLKASSLSRVSYQGNGVDRQNRHANRHSSPEGDSASRYSGSSRRSRSPRGYKRPRDDRDYRGRPRDYDSRPPRGPYDDSPRDNYQRSRVSYDDLDRPASGSQRRGQNGPDRRRESSQDRDRFRNGRDRDRDRYPDKRPRHRSRSVDREPREGKNGLDRFVRGSQSDRRIDLNGGLRYDDNDAPRGQRSASSRTHTRDVPQTRKEDTKSAQGPGHDNSVPKSEEARSEPPKEPNSAQEYEEPEPVDEEAEIERRRRRREEILAKSSSATPMLLHAVGASEKARGGSPASSQSGTPQRLATDAVTPQMSGTPLSDVASPRSPGSQDVPSPRDMDILSDKNLMNTHSNAKADEEDGPSAADYDPTIDMKEDERRDEMRTGQITLHGETHVVQTTETEPAVESQEQKASQKMAGDDDDDFDMFAEDFDEERYATKPGTVVEPGDGVDLDGDTQAKGGILEGDDKDGYYKMRIGEVMGGGRYQVQATLGRGMFSSVVRAMDTTTKKLVAIKIMRNNDALRKGGYTEISILQKLNDADPENRKHIVAFERSFDYRGHLCMAFENLSLNLREVLRKFGNNVGINLGATRTYAYQIFVALAHMRKCSIIHADLKPDNILVNESRNILKICDLGTAIDRSDAATAHTSITPYLVSRFYRAPELIMGIPYDYGVDMWSIGCTLYELYTGKILFAGDSNNQMLKAIMEIRGRITPKLYKRGQLSPQHFDDAGGFISVERDKVLGKTTVRTISLVKPTRDLRTRLMAASSGMSDAESPELHHFIDLLEHCLALNPDKRLKPADALKHPFFTSRHGVPRR